MQRYKMKLEYDGTSFVGWQFQKNGPSIQEVLQNAIFNFSKEKVVVTGAGRTDSGVHALAQVAHFDLKKKIEKKNVQYLVQDAKQQILRSHHSKKIIHIIISNYVIDSIAYDYLPLDINCNKFSIDIKFICFPKNLVKKLEELFNNHQIFINKIICTNYAKLFTKNKSCANVCESGLKLVQGINKQEVVIVPRKLEKKGFFERLFHFFK